jgi:cyclic dehypoxanthinyl futalosine synthase
MAPFHRGFGPDPVERNGFRFEFRRVSPRNLGIEAENGRVAAGAMSLMDFLRLEDQFEPIGRLGIGVHRAAASVLVFSRRPLAELSGECAVTDDTATSVRLLQVILEKKYGRTHIHYGRVASSLMFDGSADALLLIGNEALQAKKEGIRGLPIVTDLGEEWFSWHKTPFVFARWAVRRDLPQAAKQTLEKILRDSLRQDDPEASAESREYWKHFAYDFTDAHEESIERFRRLSFPSDSMKTPSPLAGEGGDGGCGVAENEPPTSDLPLKGGGGSTLDQITRKILAGKRLTQDEGLFLLKEADLMSLGCLANRVRHKKHPGNRVTFAIDSNPNYSNVCVAECLFCAFYRPPGHQEAYTLSVEQVMEKISRAAEQGATTVLLQGGLNPGLPLEYYTSLVREARRRFPRVTPHFFTAGEALMMAEVSQKSLEEVLMALKEAGQNTLPGGGAEVLSEYVRLRISPKKKANEDWIRVHRAAHKLGFKSTATMMYGHVERPEDLIEHLEKVRSLQDEYGGFTAFVPWSFKPGNTKLESKIHSCAGPSAYFRILAVSRLYLDNVPHIQATWFSEGSRTGQVALHFGADDFGGTLIDENVHKAAGHINTTTVDRTTAMIREAGFIPAQRTTLYEILRVFNQPGSSASERVQEGWNVK